MRAALTILPAAAGTAVVDIYKYVFRRDKGLFVRLFMDSYDHQAWYYLRKGEYMDAMAQMPCLRFEQNSVRGGRIRGFYYQCSPGFSKKIAFIVHGYRASHLEAAGPLICGYLQRGFDVFCCDHYAHGESQGEEIGYGAWEGEDCLHWVEFLRWRFGGDVEILVHGFSMGGNIVLHLCTSECKNIRAIIDDSGYTGADEILKSNLGILYPLMDFLRSFSTKSTIFSTNAQEIVKKAVIPVTFVHGTDDKTVPFAMGQRLYELCAGEKSRMFLEGVGHVEAMYLRPVEYWALIGTLEEKYFTKREEE